MGIPNLNILYLILTYNLSKNWIFIYRFTDDLYLLLFLMYY